LHFTLRVLRQFTTICDITTKRDTCIDETRHQTYSQTLGQIRLAKRYPKPSSFTMPPAEYIPETKQVKDMVKTFKKRILNMYADQGPEENGHPINYTWTSVRANYRGIQDALERET
jgi:hypothetical protein